MDVDLPNTGCNIIQSSTTFYNYSSDSKTRETWVIYDGKALKQSETYNQYGYTYTGTCLVDGDLVYRPELQSVWFPLAALAVFIFILSLVYKIFVKRLLP